MKTLRRLASRLTIAGEILRFYSSGRRWAMVPLVVVLLLIAGLVFLAESSILGPFIYTLF